MWSFRRGMAFAAASVAVLVSGCGAEEPAPPAASVTSEDAESARALVDAEQRAADAEARATDAEVRATDAEAEAAEEKERVATLEDELAAAEASLAELEEAAAESQVEDEIVADTVAAVEEDDDVEVRDAAGDQRSGSMTVAQENAVRSASNYLDFTAFSRSGLIGQLEFEGYSTEDATVAVDSLDVDYDQQAAKAAKNYLDFTGFSRQGLIDQLVFEGYTQEQATYGVDQTGL